MNHFFQFLNLNVTFVNCHHLNHSVEFVIHNVFHGNFDVNEYVFFLKLNHLVNELLFVNENSNVYTDVSNLDVLNTK